MAAEDMTFSITKGHRQVQGSSNDHSIMPSCLLHAQGQPSPLLAFETFAGQSHQQLLQQNSEWALSPSVGAGLSLAQMECSG